MRAEVTRIAVLLVGGSVMGAALLFSAWFAGVGVAAGSLAGPVAILPTASPEPAVPSAGPSREPAPSSAPVPNPTPSLVPAPVPTPTPAPPTGPVPTLAPGSPPPPTRGEADDCPRPPSDVKPARVVSHGDERTRIVALTFDDGFDETNTRAILEILERSHVNATFFPTGRAIAQSPEVWRAVAAAGFPIGDHTYSHPMLSDLCYAAQVSELRKQARVARSASGIRVQPYMRPPYEAWNRTTRIAATAAGERAVVVWNVDTRDWDGLTVGRITRRALHGDNGAIVLMHTTVDNTVTALPAIIRGYQERGFRFVTIGQMLGIDGPVPYR